MVWRVVVGTGIVISLILGLLAIDDRYVTCKALDQFEKKTVDTLDNFQKNQTKTYKMQRYENMTDSYYKYKAIQKSYPNDQEIKDDLNRLEQERQELKRQIDDDK